MCECMFWPTLCTLIKGNYYLQESIPLKHLRSEPWHCFALHAAIGLDEVEIPLRIVDRLLAEFPDATKELLVGDLPLHICTKHYSKHHVDMLRALLKADPSAAKQRDRDGFYPLHTAKNAGYKWNTGLGDLCQAAPYIMDLK